MFGQTDAQLQTLSGAYYISFVYACLAVNVNVYVFTHTVYIQLI